MAKNLPRGIAPELLLSQVKNTMPYLFEEQEDGLALGPFYPAQVLREYEGKVGQGLSHFEYFRLCMSCHYLTCATPVPTDVDNQIRKKLWPKELPLEVALQMSALVLESRSWDFTLVSSRYVGALSGHLGEWFTLAAAAYCALAQYRAPAAVSRRQEIFGAIRDEVNRHATVFGAQWQGNDGLNSLRASANTSHNFGDLDRVMDMWELNAGDPLRLEFYKLSAEPYDQSRKLRYDGKLWVAGEIYKSVLDGGSMSYENHRHFALRKPRCLRRARNFLIPIAPFMDEWGERVARGLADSNGAPTEDTYEVAQALRYGWSRIPNTMAYGRALRGMAEINPELRTHEVSAVSRSRAILETPRPVFEKKWNDAALAQMATLQASLKS